MRGWASLFATTLLAACATGGGGAPIDYGAGTNAPAPRAAAPIDYGGNAPAPAAQRPASAPSTPTPDWADGPGTPLSAYALQPEDVHPYDPANLPRTHRVMQGQSIYDI